MRYKCPRCGAIMVCVSTDSLPPIISYQCYGCGYLSKSVRESEIIKILPEHLQQPQYLLDIKCTEIREEEAEE